MLMIQEIIEDDQSKGKNAAHRVQCAGAYPAQSDGRICARNMIRGFLFSVAVGVSLAAASGSAFAQTGGPLPPAPVGPQTLNDIMVYMTASNCAALGATPGKDLGATLSALCSGVGGGGSVPTAGSGAAGTQGSDSSIAQSRALRRRLEQLRGKNDNQTAENQTASLVGLQIAQESFSSERWGVFVSGDYEIRDRDRTTFEDAYDSDLWSVTAGADYRLNDALTAGIALNAGKQSGDFSEGGDFDTKTYGIALYGAFYPASLEGFFADLALGYGRKSYEVSRFLSGVYNSIPVTGTLASDTNGNEFSSRLQLGKDFASGRFTFGPRAGLNYLFTKIDGTTESGITGLELRYHDRTVQSLQTTVGFQGSMAFSAGFGVISPQVSAEWVHEFKSDQQSIDVNFAEDLRPDPVMFSFANEKPDRDYFNTRAGLVFGFTGGVQAFVEGRALLGHDYFKSYGGALGIRLEL